MKEFRIMILGNPKEYWAYNVFDLASRFRKSYPQFKHLKLSDLQPITI